MTGAATRGLLVALLIATPALLLPGADAESSQITVLLACIASILTFMEYNSRQPSIVEFRDAPGGRGTWVTATLLYDPPAGIVGKVIAKLFQREPEMQVRRDLRRFKQLMETGEVATGAWTRAQRAEEMN